jgi:hypothetical protein
MTASPQTRRKRGAPKGNLNALKHGFYSEQLRRAEIAALEGVDPTSIKDEIGVLRVVVRRLIQLIKISESVPELTSLITTLSTLTGNLGRLIHVYSVVSPKKSEGDRLLDEVLAKLTRELNLDSDEPPDPPFDASCLVLSDDEEPVGSQAEGPVLSAAEGLDLSQLKELIRGQTEEPAQTADEALIVSADE